MVVVVVVVVDGILYKIGIERLIDGIDATMLGHDPMPIPYSVMSIRLSIGMLHS